MEGAAGGWDDMPAPSASAAFDVGMAFTEAELDFFLLEGRITAAPAFLLSISQRILALTLLSLHQSCWILNSMPVRADCAAAAVGLARQLHLHRCGRYLADELSSLARRWTADFGAAA